MRRFSVELSRDARRDLRSIYQHLIRSYRQFGETLEEATARANKRLRAIAVAMDELGDVPHQGTRQDNVAMGLRVVTKDRVIFYFDVDEAAKTLSVNAVFFGGQDHQRRMLRRLLSRA